VIWRRKTTSTMMTICPRTRRWALTFGLMLHQSYQHLCTPLILDILVPLSPIVSSDLLVVFTPIVLLGPAATWSCRTSARTMHPTIHSGWLPHRLCLRLVQLAPAAPIIFSRHPRQLHLRHRDHTICYRRRQRRIRIRGGCGLLSESPGSRERRVERIECRT
jgi:hypothetical protein